MYSEQSQSTFSFQPKVIDDAFAMIVEDGLNVIRCCKTAAPIGEISESEIRNTLQSEIKRDWKQSATDLHSSFLVRYFAICSRPAPSITYHRDHSQFVRLMRNGIDGPARVFTYLAGRLFFEAIEPEKSHRASQFGMALLAFRAELYDRLQSLPQGWHKSLTADDEELTAAKAASNILNLASRQIASPEAEGKSAQAALEVMLRLDSIHNLRHVLYDASLKDELRAFRLGEGEKIVNYFYSLCSLVERIESDGIVRLRKQKITPEGNAAILTTALQALGWQTARIARQQRSWEKSLVQQGNTRANNLIKEVDQIMRANGVNASLTPEDRRRLEAQMNKINDAFAPSAQDKKLDLLRKTFAGKNERRGTTQVRRGAVALKAYAETFLDKGLKVPEPLKKAITQAVIDGKIGKPTKKSRALPVNVQNAGGFSFNLSSETAFELTPRSEVLAAKKKES